MSSASQRLIGFLSELPPCHTLLEISSVKWTVFISVPHLFGAHSSTARAVFVCECGTIHRTAPCSIDAVCCSGTADCSE
uniref:Secreted protein n=1 Tax=Knipowitschia caucasica TaxID=637954 RepID=A0AAV2LPN2_KNICA